MSEPPTEVNEPAPDRPAASRRVIPEWEYRTAYIETFQVRIAAGLHERLCEWAKQESKSLNSLYIEILEEAVRCHGS